MAVAVPVVVRPFPGVLQEDGDGLQAGPQNGGTLFFFYSPKKQLLLSMLIPLEMICASLNRTSPPQVVKNNLNPVWKPFRIPLRSLCGGDVESQIKATVLKVPKLQLNACSRSSELFTPLPTLGSQVFNHPSQLCCCNTLTAHLLNAFFFCPIFSPKLELRWRL